MHVSRNKKKLTVGYNLTDASCSVYIERSCDSATPQWPHLADEILLSPDLEARGRLRAASSSSLISGGSRYFEQGEDSVSAPLSFANAHNGIPPALCTVKFPALSETNYSTTPRHFCTALASFLQSSEDSSFRPFFSLSFFSACEPSAYQTIASLSGHFPHFCYLLTYLLVSCAVQKADDWWDGRPICVGRRERKKRAAAATVGSCMLREETPGREGGGGKGRWDRESHMYTYVRPMRWKGKRNCSYCQLLQPRFVSGRAGQTCRPQSGTPSPFLASLCVFIWTLRSPLVFSEPACAFEAVGLL